MHKVGIEVTREVTKEFRPSGAWFDDNICGRGVYLPARPPSDNPRA